MNRVPADGTVTRIAYRHGAFLSASLDKAAEANERNALAIRLPDGQEIAVVQIAGLIARRIVCDVREGDAVRAGERFGIIRFGSRTDLYLPEGVRSLVRGGPDHDRRRDGDRASWRHEIGAPSSAEAQRTAAESRRRRRSARAAAPCAGRRRAAGRASRGRRSTGWCPTS